MTDIVRKHKWDPPISKLPDETPSGCEETERLCIHCGLVKITVHPPRERPYRMWRRPSGARFKMDHAPLCEDIEVLAS